MDNVIDCLQERGLIDALTSEEIRERAKRPMRVYIGFDPTADSLHLGSLLGIVVLNWFERFGHTPVAVLGGATGRIGDPSGKSLERPLLDEATIDANVESIAQHFDKKTLIFNNNSWFAKLPLIDFLRDIGKHFRIGNMLSKESIRSRLESEEGISYTEFSYLLLQAYDFYHLFTHHNVELQMGGSDQWGNITAGIELIRKLTSKTAYGLTFPLLVRSDGKKFGKSEEGAIWLNPKRCSYYQFYQYLLRIPDSDVITMMRLLTFMPLEEIKEYEQNLSKAPNEAQKRLAKEVTLFVHGEEGLQNALRVTEAAAPGAKAVLDPEIFKEVAEDMPHVTLALADVIDQKFVDLVVKTGLLSSKGEAVRLIQNGGAYLNNDKVEDTQLRVNSQHLIGGQYLLLGAGKKKKLLVSIERT